MTARRGSASKVMVRIAVLSDLHIDRERAPDSWEVAKAAFKRALVEKPDHVVIAGDLFDSSTAMLRDRGCVEQYLRRLGLWHRDRLTLVIGNHDIYDTPHHANWLTTVVWAPFGRPQACYDEFCDWASQLVGAADRVSENDALYPIEKRISHARLWAADTTAQRLKHSGNGYWRKEDHALLKQRASQVIGGERRVLAIHHSPFPDDEQSIMDMLTFQGRRIGFPPTEFRRLRRFAESAKLDAIVCGHIHHNGDAPWSWSWKFGARNTDVHLLGRTHALKDNIPCIGVLDVPEQGPSRWSTRDV